MGFGLASISYICFISVIVRWFYTCTLLYYGTAKNDSLASFPTEEVLIPFMLLLSVAWLHARQQSQAPAWYVMKNKPPSSQRESCSSEYDSNSSDDEINHTIDEGEEDEDEDEDFKPAVAKGVLNHTGTSKLGHHLHNPLGHLEPDARLPRLGVVSAKFGSAQEMVRLFRESNVISK